MCRFGSNLPLGRSTTGEFLFPPWILAFIVIIRNIVTRLSTASVKPPDADRSVRFIEVYTPGMATFLPMTVVCLRCFTNAPMTASYCNRCGTMLRTPESRGEYHAQYASRASTPTPAESDSDTRPQLIKDVINLLILYWNQFDWKTLGAVLDALSKFHARGEGATGRRTVSERIERMVRRFRGLRLWWILLLQETSGSLAVCRR